MISEVSGSIYAQSFPVPFSAEGSEDSSVSLDTSPEDSSVSLDTSPDTSPDDPSVDSSETADFSLGSTFAVPTVISISWLTATVLEYS